MSNCHCKCFQKISLLLLTIIYLFLLLFYFLIHYPWNTTKQSTTTISLPSLQPSTLVTLSLSYPDRTLPKEPELPTPSRFSVTNASEAQLEGRIFSDNIRNLWRTPTPMPPPQRKAQPQQKQQQQQLASCNQLLQREFGLVRPQAQRRVGTPSSEAQQTHHCSFQHERLRMPYIYEFPCFPF